jgi:queuine tRNA-ribosyltransferase
MKKPITFSIEKEIPNQMGRAGILETPHGTIATPAFVPVATKATLKGVLPQQIIDLGLQVVLANTYHLYLEPGDERVATAGGLHNFMQWNGPIMTDSGGFQVFSLGVAFGSGILKIQNKKDGEQVEEIKLADSNADVVDGRGVSEHFKPAKIDANGVTFRSHIDGSAHYFTPEKSIEIQHNLGADIIFAFDECTATGESDHYQAEALDRTHRWAKQSLEFHLSKPKQAEKQALFGIVQGGRVEKLRRESAKFMKDLDFDGFGIGGGFEKKDMSSAVQWVNEELPKEKPRHLLGIGEPEDLLMAIERGCDLFDCVAPARLARTGTMYTKNGKVNLMRSEFRDDFSKLDETSTLPLDTQFTKAYVSHLFRAKEMLGAIILTQHNLHFINQLVVGAREAILEDKFEEYKNDFLKEYSS